MQTVPQKSLTSKLMTFSPPHKAQRKEPNSKKAAEVAIKEYLILQPFSSVPQLTFADVLPGTKTTRLLEIRNTSDIDHVVIVDKIPVANGFSVEPDVLIIPAGDSKEVTFVWSPTEATTSCRCAVNVRSEQGYRGRVLLLGTIKKILSRPVKAAKKTEPRVLVPSQKVNVKKPSVEAAKGKGKSTRLVTVPVEFKIGKRSTAQPDMKRNVTFKSSKPATPKLRLPNVIPAPATKLCFATQIPEAPLDSPNMRRETFTCKDTIQIPAHSTAVWNMEDSLEVANEVPTKDGTFTPPSAKKCSHTTDECPPASSEKLDFSGRMEELYRRLIEEGVVEDDSFTAPHSVRYGSEEKSAQGLGVPLSEARELREECAHTPVDTLGSSRLTFAMPEHLGYEGPNTKILQSSSYHENKRPSVTGLWREYTDVPFNTIEPSRLTFEASGQCCAGKRSTAEASRSASLPDILDMIRQFEDGVYIDTASQGGEDISLLNMIDEYISEESPKQRCAVADFFPSYISSIHSTPAKKHN